jgi:hypothetical protein
MSMMIGLSDVQATGEGVVAVAERTSAGVVTVSVRGEDYAFRVDLTAALLLRVIDACAQPRYENFKIGPPHVAGIAGVDLSAYVNGTACLWFDGDTGPHAEVNFTRETLYNLLALAQNEEAVSDA